MLFQKKVDRAMKLSGEKADKRRTEEYDPKAWQEEQSLSDSMEKGDLAAILISAMLVIVPVCLAAILIICFLGSLPLIF